MDIENENKCFYCNDDYKKLSLSKYSKDITHYVKHLGFCQIGCYDDYSFHHPELIKKLKRDKLILSLSKYNKS